ncbi:hypothetical protein [Paenibacillus sp. NPDC058177]|uniref:hypothetical protein n=1 Tax=Paenibacillus sp. NPDC058177 TaxID=3346369 RepID=UPI0036D99614
MKTILIILLTLLIGSLQIGFGFKKKSTLARIFPVALIVFVITFFIVIHEVPSVRDIIITLLGLLGLLILYAIGKRRANHSKKSSLTKY